MNFNDINIKMWKIKKKKKKKKKKIYLPFFSSFYI